MGVEAGILRVLQELLRLNSSPSEIPAGVRMQAKEQYVVVAVAAVGLVEVCT